LLLISRGTLGLLRCVQERAFELGERLAVLSQVNQPSIIPHMAEVEGKRFPYEVRSGWRMWEGHGRGMQPCACLPAQARPFVLLSHM
jgi:hypothetical protein